MAEHILGASQVAARIAQARGARRKTVPVADYLAVCASHEALRGVCWAAEEDAARAFFANAGDSAAESILSADRVTALCALSIDGWSVLDWGQQNIVTLCRSHEMLRAERAARTQALLVIRGLVHRERRRSGLALEVWELAQAALAGEEPTDGG